MKLVSLLCLLCFSTYGSDALDFSIFDDFQDKYSKSYMKKRIDAFLAKDKDVSKYYGFVNNNLVLKDDKAQVEYELPLVAPRHNEVIQIPMKKIIKIALDPGHLGGSYAKLEGRYFHQIPVAGNGHRDDLVVKEGEINLFTAQVLKEKLEAIGIEVFMTRDQIGVSSFGKKFEQWEVENYVDWIEEQIKDLDIAEQEVERKKYLALDKGMRFYHFSRADLYNRAKVTNDFQPDLAISLHYNSCGRKYKNGRYETSKENFAMVFTGGSFEGAELVHQNHRFNFLRLLLTDHIETSYKVGYEVVKQFRDQLKIDIVDPDKHVSPYLWKNSMKLDEGVYARNLAYVREVHAPAILGEPTCADYPAEGLLLDSLTVNKNSPRIQAVANSYFQGIVKAFGL